MFVAPVLAVAGLVLLTVSADHLVLGSSRVAAKLRVSPVVVGVVVIGLGTSAPELLVSGLAAARGDTGIAVGNLVGSNILNLTLILGVAALIGTVGVSSTVIRREVRLAVVAVAMFAVAAWIGLSVWTGAVLAIHLSIHLLDKVIAELTPHYGADCPVAIVWRASWPDQRIVRATLATLDAAVGTEMERTALILVGKTLGAADFDESRLYAVDYDRRYRPVGAEPRFPEAS